jgi:N-acetylmuramic acid 6-phosphate etherase
MIGLPQTEAVDEGGVDLDLLDVTTLVARLIDAQRGAVDAVARQRGAIAEVVEAIVARIERGGHLHYVGSGSSGRIAALDAAEMPPTFGVEPDLVEAHVAGGPSALTRAVEGAEDDASAGEAAMAGIGSEDAVIGLSASGSAAYVVAAISVARRRGALTVALTSSEPSALGEAAERCIVLATGAEPIAGSTRLRAGTAQKIALNAISTAVMVRLGKVYENLMVDVAATNRKLAARALRIVSRVGGVTEEHASELLELSGGSAKMAIVMAWRGCDASEARSLIERHRGRLRSVLAEG